MFESLNFLYYTIKAVVWIYFLLPNECVPDSQLCLLLHAQIFCAKSPLLSFPRFKVH